MQLKGNFSWIKQFHCVFHVIAFKNFEKSPGVIYDKCILKTMTVELSICKLCFSLNTQSVWVIKAESELFIE